MYQFHVKVRFLDNTDTDINYTPFKLSTIAGGGEGRDGVFSTGRRKICLQARPQSHVRVHGQLHQEAEEPAREVHDEQCAGELHNPSGKELSFLVEVDT